MKNPNCFLNADAPREGTGKQQTVGHISWLCLKRRWVNSECRVVSEKAVLFLKAKIGNTHAPFCGLGLADSEGGIAFKIQKSPSVQEGFGEIDKCAWNRRKGITHWADCERPVPWLGPLGSQVAAHLKQQPLLLTQWEGLHQVAWAF